MTPDIQIRELINRLGRLDAAAGWDGDLNPTQRAALGYLSRANRFSRSPSHVSDYLGTTRGTTTQSLKSLLQKGYVAEQRSAHDKRVISYALTPAGQKAVEAPAPLQGAIAKLDAEDQQLFQDLLSKALQNVLRKNEGREFGLCKTCVHHHTRDAGPFCALLNVSLSPHQTNQICHEQESA